MKKKMFYLFIIFGSVFSGGASAAGLIDMLRKGGEVLGVAGVLFLGVITFVGLFIGFKGLMRMRVQEGGRRQEGGVVMLILGIAIAMLPWIYAATTLEFTGEEVDVTSIKEDVYD